MFTLFTVLALGQVLDGQIKVGDTGKLPGGVYIAERVFDDYNALATLSNKHKVWMTWNWNNDVFDNDVVTTDLTYRVIGQKKYKAMTLYQITPIESNTPRRAYVPRDSKRNPTLKRSNPRPGIPTEEEMIKRDQEALKRRR